MPLTGVQPDKISVVNGSQQQHHDHVHDYDTIAHTWQDGPYSFIIFTEGNEQSSENRAKKATINV